MVIMAESCPDTSLSQESVSSIFTPPTPGLILDSSDEDESVISSRPTTPPPFLVHRMHLNPTKHNELSLFRNVEVCRSLPSPPRPQEGQVSSNETGIMGGESEAFVPEPQSPVKRLHDRPRRCANTPNKTPPGDSMPLDRFIPVREFTTPPSTTFHVGQSTEELSPEEKMLRRRLDREDPFMVTWQGRAASSPRMASDHLRSPHITPRLVTDAAITTQHSHQATGSLRHVSAGAVWRVGGVAAALGRRPNGASGGSGSVLARGTTARMYTAKFLPQATPANEQREYEKKKHEARLALALDIDRSKRLLKNSKCWPLLEFTPCPAKPDFERFSPLVWENSAWRRAGQDRWTAPSKEDDKATVVPTLPFRVLDAPGLRDDFYCSTLAYSSVSGILAVALASEVYLWSDEFGVQHPPFSDQLPSNYVSSLSFSSENGRKSILAVGRRSGLLSLWSTFDSEARFEVSHPDSITCVAFKQSKTRRLSERFKNAEMDTEDLAVGDDLGYIWYYSVEWPDDEQAQLGWEGSMTLLAKISAHSQQVCGISWSPDGTYLATGGNDNACLIFELQNIIPPGEFRVPADFTAQTESDNNSTSSPTDNDQDSVRDHLAASISQNSGQVTMDAMSKSLIAYAGTVISGCTRTAMIPTNYQKHRLDHGAAVKAIAFAPWQPSLLATGGGSNDRAIHFYHTPSGACLATIKVYAQVTGLIWSRTRREIVATFGFSNPEHPFRIAVFAWPSCEQISAIPWGPYGTSWRGPLETDRTIDCGRALCAISYPCRVPIYLYHRLKIQDDSSVRGPRAEANQRRQSAPLERTSTQPRAKEGGLWCSRTMDEGCIIVASSDHTVKFHEVWSNSRRNIASDSGPYGGSEILEGLEGLEKTGEEIIR